MPPKAFPLLAVILPQLTALLTAVRVFHWQTRSYIAHKESGVLYESLDKSIDAFVECLRGYTVNEKSPGPDEMLHAVSRHVQDMTFKGGSDRGALGEFLAAWAATCLEAKNCPIAQACAMFPSLHSIRDDVANAIQTCRYLVAMSD
jgi:hypothetical protein